MVDHGLSADMHWMWGGGWLADLGAMDFAGGIVIHVMQRRCGVSGALVLGKEEVFQPPPCLLIT